MSQDSNTISGVFNFVPNFNSTLLISTSTEQTINFETIPAVRDAIANVGEYNVHHFNLRYTPTANINLIPVDNWAELQLIVPGIPTDGASSTDTTIGLPFNLRYSSVPFSLYTRITHRTFRKTGVNGTTPLFPVLRFRSRTRGVELAAVGRVQLEYIIEVRSNVGPAGELIPVLPES